MKKDYENGDVASPQDVGAAAVAAQEAAKDLRAALNDVSAALQSCHVDWPTAEHFPALKSAVSDVRAELAEGLKDYHNGWAKVNAALDKLETLAHEDDRRAVEAKKAAEDKADKDAKIAEAKAEQAAAPAVPPEPAPPEQPVA